MKMIPIANGFQIVEPERPGQFLTEAGASYMGFGVSALLATAIARRLFYYGPNELGGMGVFGRWSVGNWSADTQALRHRIGL